MNRLMRWLRLWRWWLASQQTLAATVVRLEQEVVTVRADYEKELLALEALHNEGMALQRKHIEELRVECQRWEEQLSDSERRRMEEVRKGNAAWQEAGIQRRRADGLQAERDELRAELARRAVAVDAS